jgi:hypothetical protein
MPALNACNQVPQRWRQTLTLVRRVCWVCAVDDGTAVARCVFWTPTLAQEDSIQLGVMLRVQGRPSVYRGALQITTNTIRACLPLRVAGVCVGCAHAADARESERGPVGLTQEVETPLPSNRRCMRTNRDREVVTDHTRETVLACGTCGAQSWSRTQTGRRCTGWTRCTSRAPSTASCPPPGRPCTRRKRMIRRKPRATLITQHTARVHDLAGLKARRRACCAHNCCLLIAVTACEAARSSRTHWKTAARRTTN